MAKWSIRPCPDGWAIYDTTGQWHDTEGTFSEALKLAQQYALSERIFQPDGLEWFARKTGTWRVKNG